MDAEFWHQRWLNNEIGFHQKEINTHLQSFWSGIRAAPGSRVFVPLCGKSRDMLWLRSQGHEVIGVEISPVAVKAFFSENALTPTVEKTGKFQRWECDGIVILLGDFFDLIAEDLGHIDAVFDRASLVALPPEMRRHYAQHLREILPQSVSMLLVTMQYDQNQMKGPPFAVETEEVSGLYADFYRLDCRFTLDVLAENPKFRDRGITRMEERVFLLTPHQK